MLLSGILLITVLLTNCADVASCVFARHAGVTFDLSGQVLVNDNSGDPILCLTDATGAVRIMGIRHVTNSLPFASGDIIRTSGVVAVPSDTLFGTPVAICRSVRKIADGMLPPPATATAADIQSGRYDCRHVRVRGRIRRVFRDEIDPRWIFTTLNAEDGLLYLTTRGDAALETQLRKLTDAEVTVTGICSASGSMLRRLLGQMVGFSGTNDITVLRAPSDPFSVPLLEDKKFLDVSSINKLGRHRLLGQVLATDSSRRTLVRSDQGDTHDVRLLNDPIPQPGQRVEVVGIPEADFYYQVNLLDALWRPAAVNAKDTAASEDLPVGELLTDDNGRLRVNPNFHGRLVRFSGTVIDLPTTESGRTTAILKGDSGTVFLDFSAARDILGSVSLGCTVDVTGICSVNRDATDPQQGFQRMTGVTLILRSPDDLQILSRPPWWTPFRLASALGLLFVAFVAIVIWNRILQRIIDRKSRQLLKEQVAQIKAALRVDERTHLAVELHDSLSQNLSGVACQIAATKGTLTDDTGETARYLATAERMLLSCRTELRRCLWDLRGDALEDSNFAEAIRKTLAPVAIGIETVIRFNVPRSRLSDSTAHAVLCIIRELVANAIRHGKAKTVRIAGELHDGTLSFSVRDDGQGFDPASCNGPAEGHFGLEGIRERIKHLDGSFVLTSEHGKGTRAEVTLTSILTKEEKTET